MSTLQIIEHTLLFQSLYCSKNFKKNPVGVAEWLGIQSQSGCLGFDQELPSSSLGNNTLKKPHKLAIYPVIDPPVTNNDQSLIESCEKTPWKTKKKNFKRERYVYFSFFFFLINECEYVDLFASKAIKFLMNQYKARFE